MFSLPLLSESLHPNARLGGAETSSARLAAVRKPQPLTPKLRVPLLGDTHCSAAATDYVESRHLSPPPNTLCFAGEHCPLCWQSSELTLCPTPRPFVVSPTLGELGRSAGAVPGVAAEISHGSFSTPSLCPEVDSPALPRVWWWLWAFASHGGSFDLKRHLPNKRNKEVTKGGGAEE